MIKPNDSSTAPSQSQSANELYDQLLQGGRARASHSVHNAKHKANLRNMLIVAVLILAGTITALLT